MAICRMKRPFLERLKKEGIEFLQLQFTDLMGNVKSLTVPKIGLRT